MKPYEVEELVNSAKNGSLESFERLFSIYEKNLYFQALILLNNTRDAEDAVQDTALQAFRYIKDLKNDKYFKTWLTKILINVCKKLKYNIFKNKHNDFYESNIWSEPLAESEAELMDIINRLDKNSKLVITLRFIYSLKISEISAMLNIPEGTVKSRLSRGLKKLKKNLKEAENYGY